MPQPVISKVSSGAADSSELEGKGTPSLSSLPLNTILSFLEALPPSPPERTAPLPNSNKDPSLTVRHDAPPHLPYPSFHISPTSSHLLFPKSDSASTPRHAIIDHAFSPRFASNLKSELLETFHSKLSPGKLSSKPTATERTLLSLSGGRTAIRGDLSTFLPVENDDDGSFLSPHWKHLKDSLQREAERVFSPFIFISGISAQLAVYPGDRKSGYIRHLDTGTISEDDTEPRRIVTVIYYLNEDWTENDGGCLRIHSLKEPPGTEMVVEDVAPHSDRMLLFRSDLVQHEVLPSTKERVALTVWFYGTFRDNKEAPFSNWNSNPLPPPLSLPSIPQDEKGRSDNLPTIFVSIASYRDPELQPTILSLFSTARHPQRIRIGVVNQLSLPQDDRIVLSPQTPFFNNIRIMTVSSRHSTGPCNARAQAQTLYRNETYYLQIDSHMRFRPNWDTFLIDMLERHTRHPGKSIITTYPPGYTLPHTIPTDDLRPTVLVPQGFDGDTGMLRQKGRRLRSVTKNGLIPAIPLLAAGFHFARGSVIQQVPYDGNLHGLFLGEEMSMSVRLFWSGYDFYAPGEVVCWHLWQRNGVRPTFWEGYKEHQKVLEEQKKKSLEVVRGQILRGEGSTIEREDRGLKEFERLLGVDFSLGVIQDEARDGGLEKGAFADYKEGGNTDDKVKELVNLFLGGMV